MFEMTLATAVEATTTKVRKPVTLKTLSCLSIQTGGGVTTKIIISIKIIPIKKA